jgi:leucyl-tRNA synthetase
LFAAPPEKDLEWSEQAIEGCSRFLQRVYRLVEKHAEALKPVASKSGADVSLDSATPKEKALLRKAHQVLRRVSHDFETRWHFNSAIALLMELINEIHDHEPLEEGMRPEVTKQVFELMILMLNPMVPHLSEELWEMLGHTQDTLAHAAWPKFVPELAAEDQVEIVVQMNGRVKGRLTVEAGLDKAALEKRALADPKIAQLLNGQRVVKVIVVPDKLVNIVVS